MNEALGVFGAQGFFALGLRGVPEAGMSNIAALIIRIGFL